MPLLVMCQHIVFSKAQMSKINQSGRSFLI